MRLICMCLLLLFLTPWTSAQTPDLSALEGETWYGLYMTGKKAGYSMTRIEIGEEGAVTVVEDASFKLNMAGIKQDMRIYNKRVYRPDGSLHSIDSRVDDIAGTNLFLAVVEGDKIVLTSTVGGEKSVKRLPAPKESLQDMLKYMELLQDNPQEGDSISFSLFEPMYQTEIGGESILMGEEERVLDGVPTKVYIVKTKLTMMGIESVGYITEDGRILEDKVAGGIITMRLEPKEIAKDVQYTNDTIISNAALVEERISRPRTRESLKLRVKGPLTSDQIFNDDRQSFSKRVDSHTFIGLLESLDGFTSATIPITDEEVVEWLTPSTFVQSDNIKLITAAQEIVGDETDSKKISDKLVRWVNRNMHATFSARLTNSLEVLENREGDCTEHSMLYIGLARAAGLPAREVAGLIYVDSPEPGFYFHQWAKVWVGKWIEVDPTFDQTIADATHIKLAEGDLFEQTKILPLIGQLGIEVFDDQ